MKPLRRPTIIDEDAEHERASYWRRRIMLMKHDRLSEQVGWSVRQIYQLESGAEIAPQVWCRYKLACAGLHARTHGWQKGRAFNWRL